MTPVRRRNLQRLLDPAHIAFIGGDNADFAAGLCANAGYKGKIWGVNPHRKIMGGAPCFAGIDDLPEAPDAVFLAVPHKFVVETVRSLRDAGTGGIACFTAGFGELGAEGVERERALVDAAGDLALVGPNCQGVLNYVNQATLWPFGYPFASFEKGAALISQSGMLCSNLTMQQRSIPFSYVISAGNQAVLGVEDYLDVLIDDDAVTAVGLYIEGLRDIPRFSEVAMRALQAGVPIVALKAGSSKIGAQVTITHTGSLSGSERLYQALFDRVGVVQVDTPAVLLETLKLVSVSGAPAGRRLAAFTLSGGEAAILADVSERLGLELVQPSRRTAAALARRLPDIATVSNPLDLTTPLWGDEEKVPGVIGTLLDDGFDTALLVQDYPTPESGISSDQYHADARSFINATRAAGIPAAVCSSLPENIEEQTRLMLIAGGVTPLQGIQEALQAIAGAASYGMRRGRIGAMRDAATIGLAPLPPLEDELEVLDEWEGKSRLAAWGIPIPEGRLVAAGQAADAAGELGFPVAVKLVDRHLHHKTEAGALRLGLESREEVTRAVRAILESVAGYAPDIPTGRFLSEKMVSEPVAELLLGIRRDPQFGLAMVLASGGTLVELVDDARTLLLPADRDSIRGVIDRLKIAALMDGYRGRPPADKEALTDLILDVTRFALESASTLSELEINPLMVLPDGGVAADVLLRMAAGEG